MILKTDAQGGVVRAARRGHASSSALREYDQACTLDGQPSVALSVYQRPGSNALETAELVQDKMDELKERFPEGVDYAIVYDTTPFIIESVNEVFKTLRDAVILVAFVVLLFLQNWRSALIPLVAVPVAIVGTFAVMAAMGFSLNNLTLFGLVLAIGIVVDDAIVVVEAVEHHIELGLAPREATITAMDQVSAPVIAVGLVLTAVFVPCAFITGITGQFYRQFALDDRDLDGDLGVQLADAEPGPLGRCCCGRGRRACSRRCPGRPSRRPAAGWAIRCWARSSRTGASERMHLQLPELADTATDCWVWSAAGRRRAGRVDRSGLLNRLLRLELLPVQPGLRRRHAASTPGSSAACCA